MRYFDLAGIEVEEALASRLGFKRVFKEGTDVSIAANKLHGNRKMIAYGKNPGFLSKSLKNRDVIGIIIEQNTLVKKLVEEVKANNKLLVLSASDLTSVSTSERLRNLSKMRRLSAFASHIHAETALVTLAKEPEYLLSAMQLVEIAKLVGIKDAPRAANAIGILDDTKKKI